MKKFIFAAALLVGFRTLAMPLPELFGTFNFAETELKVTQEQHKLKIVANTAAAQKFIKELRNSSYACVAGPSAVYQCRKFISEISENPEIRQNVLRGIFGKSLSFEQPLDDFSLVNEGDSLLEFERTQATSYGNEKFTKVHLYVTADLKKLRLYDTLTSTESYFYLQDNGRIAKQIVTDKTNKSLKPGVIEDKNIYVYEAVWKQ